ncbi:MAG: 50S ribosomal protein L22 [Candidatus Yanofskybacteria bacterium]|nr:50S ribosomal protein L22 [Candidatus Yanofskybacteria bacterium]
MAQVTAKLNNLRLAPRKVRAVVNLIKGKNVLDALAQLEALVKRSGSSVAKLLRSAIANAENNNNMVKENLYVKSINVDEGVKLKRFKPKGFGRVSPIEKKTSRIRLVLAEKVAGLKRTPAEKKIKEKTIEQTQTPDRQEVKKPLDLARGKPEVKTELGRKEGVLKGLGRRMFQRKSI